MNPQPQSPCLLQEGSWKDFREEVKRVNPELFEIIEKISPDDSYRLIKASYIYGAYITKNCVLQLPTNNENRLASIHSPDVDNRLKELLGYNPTPLMLQLKNTSELFVDTGDRIIPISITTPGSMEGLYDLVSLHTSCPIKPGWNITSGARSVVMGPKISDNIGHQRLKQEFGLAQAAPKTLYDQWRVMKTVANRARQDDPWRNEVLFFTKKWTEERRDSAPWMNFLHYLSNLRWKVSRFDLENVEYNAAVINPLSKTIKERNIKPSPYMMDTIKHLSLVLTGAMPGFAMVDNTETSLPSRCIEDAYMNVYGKLKDQAPVLLVAWSYREQDKRLPLYYSLANPTLFEGSPEIRRAPNIITELRETKQLVEILLDIRKQLHLYRSDKTSAPIFEYFHSDDDQFGELLNTRLIGTTDPTVIKAFDAGFKSREFPAFGHFFRGCIRISHPEG